MPLSPEVDCTDCPKLCCHSLARTGYGFADPADTPRMCTHCDITSITGCRIHKTLIFKSRTCHSYTCHGVGQSIVELFGLKSDEMPPVHIRTTFRQRQGIAFYLIQLKNFLDENSDDQLLELRQLCAIWEKKILSSYDFDKITLDIFVQQLNALMKKCEIGYDVKNKMFCLLTVEV